MIMQRLTAGEVRDHGNAVVGMAGMLLSSCYVTLGENAEAYSLLTFLIRLTAITRFSTQHEESLVTRQKTTPLTI